MLVNRLLFRYDNSMHTLTITTTKKDQVISLNDVLEEYLEKEGHQNGLCTVFALHTTCAITTADLDPGTDLDFLDAIRNIIPSMQFRHPHDPSHAPDHILSSIIGPEVTLPVHNGKLFLGSWQEVVLIELDGP